MGAIYTVITQHLAKYFADDTLLNSQNNCINYESPLVHWERQEGALPLAPPAVPTPPAQGVFSQGGLGPACAAGAGEGDPARTRLGGGRAHLQNPGLLPPAPQAGAYLTAGARCSHPGAQALLPHGPGAPLSGPEGGREERDCEHMRRVTAKTLSGRPAR